MSTHHNVGKEQEATPLTSSVPLTPDSLQEEKVLPGLAVPQPPRQPSFSKRNRWLVIGAVIGIAVIILSLVAVFVPGLIHPGPTPTPTPIVQQCPAGTSSLGYWDTIIGTNNGEKHVGSVSCAGIGANSTLQALVTVRHSDAEATLDVYVFNNIGSSKPTQVFQLLGLVKGDAKISGSNTVMTAEVDKNASLNAGKSISAMTPDLFREFKWSASQGTLVQTVFPGLYPDLTRYQAENDQAQVNKGQETWKNDPRQVASKISEQFFGWKRILTTQMLNGGGSQDVDATVQVQEAPVQGTGQGPSAIVTLSRLEGNTHNMWVVVGVKDGTKLTLDSIQAQSLISSPVKLEGTGITFENTIGMAFILDHQYTKIGQALLTGKTEVNIGNAPYSVQVNYETSFKPGPQEGIVEVLLNTPIEADPQAAVVVKVLLDPQPRVALGAVSCPLATQHSGYWETVLGIDTSTGSVGTVSCASLKDDPSLQVLVPVYHPNSQTADIYIYDHITDAHPVQLFKLQGLTRGSAMISGVNTVLTAQVDPNSSINKGKSDAQLTTDLYREFQWDSKSGSFVQVVFPGMYPDLTRYQAEVAQSKTMLQQNTWQLDALQTAQHFTAQFLPAAPTNPPLQLHLVSGGGAHDLTAQINAAFPITGSSLGPVTRITLTRLEGNARGIWEVTAVQADWMAILSPEGGPTAHISNSATVTGYGSQFESQVGTVYILDHLFTRIGNAFAMGSAGFGSGPFTTTVTYTSSFQGGAQEGIVELAHGGGASFDSGVVMVKVLLNP